MAFFRHIIFMRCPSCEGEVEPVSLRDRAGDLKEAKRCGQCGGFWFESGQDDDLSVESVLDYDVANPNYTMKSYNLVCPSDQTLLNQSERDALPTGLNIWNCPDCSGTFYPRGQLALATNWQAEQAKQRSLAVYSRSRMAMAVLLLVFGGIFFGFASQNFSAVGQTLPTEGPNIMMLVLIAISYLAGTVLAVLGRKLPIIFLGWGVILFSLFGFSILIFAS